MARLPVLRRRQEVAGPSALNPNTLSAASLSAAGLDSRSLRSLTAAGFRITHQDTDQLRRLISPWQTRAFNYYDQLGEIKYASQFYSRMLSPLRLYAAELDENGDWVETENEQAIAALDRIQDPGGGREGLLSAYGRLMFLVGESYLLCTIDPDSGVEQWEMLSTDELRIQSGIYVRYKAPSLAAEQLHEVEDGDFEPLTDKQAVAYRLWKKHPRFSALPDSTMMGVLDECEELLLLTRAVRARAKSRLAGSGILAISEDFSMPMANATPDEDIQTDVFLSNLVATMMLPIANEGTASAVVPLVVRGPTAAVKDGIKHIQLVDPTQLYPETGLRYELIKRIAIGLDMPPEVLLGLTDANHWTAWQIDEQTWKGHGQPIANALVNDLTQAFFRPQLREDGLVDYARYSIAYDATAIINHPDRTKDAKDLYDRRALGKTALRDAAGFDEEDAPTSDELAEMVGIATRDSALAWFGTPAPRGGALEVAPGVIEQAGPGGTSGDGTTGPVTGAETEEGPPAATPADTENETTAMVGGAMTNGHLDALLSRIEGAADLAILRAREAAGNRLLSLARRNPEIYALVEGVPARDVAATLGVDNVRALQVSERDLVAYATPLIRDALRLWGLDDTIVGLIVEQVERHAARTLYDARPSPLPLQFRSYVVGMVTGARR